MDVISAARDSATSEFSPKLPTTISGDLKSSVIDGEVLTADDIVTVYYQPRWPLDSASFKREFPAGESINELIQRLGTKTQGLGVSINGHEVYREYWGRVRPKAGTQIFVRRRPAGGGGGKSIWRIIGMIAILALAVAAPYLLGLAGLAGFAATPILGGLMTVGQLISATILVGGTLLLNALAPPPKPKLDALGGSASQDSPTYFVNGAQNAFRPYGIIPRVFGKHRMVPPYGALPFTETVGNDQYVRMLFCWGYGPLELTDLRIGETALENYTGYELYHHQGYAGDAPPFKLFLQDIYEQAEQVTLLQTAGFNVRTTQPDCDECSIDITFFQGLFYIYSTDGKKNIWQVKFEVKFAPTGTTNFEGAGETFIARDSPSIPASSADSNGRYVVVGINAFSGEIEVIEGDLAYGATTPVVPAVPENFLALAQVHRPAGQTNINAGDITDLRATARNSGSFQPGAGGDLFGNTGDSFQTALYDIVNDFAPSADSPVSDVIVIGAGELRPFQIVAAGRTTAALRNSLRIKFPARGQYDIYVKRVTTDTSPDQQEPSISDVATWTAIRSATYADPVKIANLVFTELRIKASDQLQGVVNEFNGVAASILPDWDSVSQTWITRTTSSPAACFRSVLQDAANRRPMADSRLDLTNLQDWAEYCEDNGLEFNQVRDFEASVWDTLADIASVGRARPTIRSGTKWGVVIDRPQEAVAQLFTARNVKDYTVEKPFIRLPHAWRCRFFNRNKDWRQDERTVYADGYTIDNATDFNELELTGITDPDHIWKDGRFHYAVLQNRPELHSFVIDFELLACERGARIAVAHDVPLHGVGAARIKTITENGSNEAVSITVDKPFPVNATLQYAIRIRSVTADPNGGYVRVYNVTPSSISSDRSSELQFDSPVASYPFEVGDLIAFGVRGTEAADLVIKDIVPIDDFSAKLICWHYSPEVYTSDVLTVPPFNSSITVPFYRTAIPGIAAHLSDESALQILPDGSWKPRIAVTLSATSPRFAELVYIDVWVQADGTTEPAQVQRHPVASTFYVDNVDEGTSYNLKYRYVDYNGKPLAWSAIYMHTVIGATTPPPDVTEVYRDHAKLRWSYPVVPADFWGFKVYKNFGTSRSLSSAQETHIGVLTANEFDLVDDHFGEVTYLVVAVDVAGNESINAAWITVGFGDLIPSNLQEMYDDDGAGFPGTIVDGTVSLGVLQADDDGGLYLVGGSASYLPDGTQNYLGATYAAMEYTTTYTVQDVSLLPGLVLVALTAEGFYTAEFRRYISLPYINDGADSASYLPVGSDPYLPNDVDANWIPWTGTLAVGTDFAGMDFRLTFQSGEARGRVLNLDFILDVEDESEYIDDFVVGPSGSRLTLQKSYRIIKNIRLTLQDDEGNATGAWAVDKDHVLGPLIETFYNTGSTKTLTSGLVDVQVIGAKA